MMPLCPASAMLFWPIFLSYVEIWVAFARRIPPQPHAARQRNVSSSVNSPADVNLYWCWDTSLC
jgi:hypothetical protein